MSKTASLSFHSSHSFADRILSFLASVFDRNAEIAYRNGDVPYFGL